MFFVFPASNTLSQGRVFLLEVEEPKALSLSFALVDPISLKLRLQITLCVLAQGRNKINKNYKEACLKGWQLCYIYWAVSLHISVKSREADCIFNTTRKKMFLCSIGCH